MYAKKDCDRVMVLYHGGKEHYRYPSPSLRKTCRKFVEKGADLVVCQHSHCIGCEEKFLGGTIVYGQGNFIFDYADNEFWQTGLLIRIDDDFNIDYLPIEKQGNKVRLANNEEAAEIICGFRQRSEEIKTEGFVEENYKEFADRSVAEYLTACFGKRRFLAKVINKILNGKYYRWKAKRKFSEMELLKFENMLECEAHRELFLRGLYNKTDRE